MVLVTGASGYLGQWSCRTLRDAGYDVRGFARTPRPSSVNDDVEWVQGDVTEGVELNEAMQGCNRVLHLACLPFGPSGQDPVEAETLNSLGTVRVLEAARHARVEHTVYTSTAYVYETRTSTPTRELDPTLPESPYGASKLAGELWCTTYRRVFGLSICTLRIFNVYGLAADGRPRPTVETIFLRELQQGRRPMIKGNPESVRDFVHVSDVMRAVVNGVNGVSGVYNVGTGEPTTLVTLARLAASTLGLEIEPEVVVTEEKPNGVWAETTLAHAGLGFRSQVTLEAGLASLRRTPSE